MDDLRQALQAQTQELKQRVTNYKYIAAELGFDFPLDDQEHCWVMELMTQKPWVTRSEAQS